MWIFMVPAMVRTAPEPDAVLPGGFQRGFAQLGMRGQAEIIVGREIDDLLAVEGADRRLLVVEHAQLEVSALLLEFVQLIGKEGKRIGAGSVVAMKSSLQCDSSILSREAMDCNEIAALQCGEPSEHVRRMCEFLANQQRLWQSISTAPMWNL